MVPYIFFVDDSSRMTFVYSLKNKSETLDGFKDFKANTEIQADKRITSQVTMALNFVIENLICICRRTALHQKTNSYSSEQNGLCEHRNNTIIEQTISLLFDAKLDKQLWTETISTAV